MADIILDNFRDKDENLLRTLITSVGWTEDQINGQISSIVVRITDRNGFVLLARQDNQIRGYISAEFYEWNRLGQIHGLVVDPNNRRQKIATKLIEEVEKFMKGKDARGVYVDTPIDNIRGRNFYEAIGYKEAYRMPEYYDKGKDGITFIKFF